MYFVLFVVYAGFANTARDAANLIAEGEAKDRAMSAVSSDGWFAFFAFVNSFGILAFGLIIGKYRYELIPIEGVVGAGVKESEKVAGTTSV